ncbi:MAG: glycosyl transferase [Candidatus Nealsonbacteria bacterium]|nr:MAG: glycosyl transferase [Candidatus Nealsonbacteria bacterium]
MTKTEYKPTVSVIIPTYNRAHLIGRAIQSVLDQTYQDFEIIVVDDASTDNTKEVVKSFGDKRIKYLRLRENSGSSAAPKNTAIKITKGKYIALLDSDDEWLPEKLEKQIQLFKNSKKKNLGFVGCNVLVVDEQTNKRYEYKTPKYKNVFQRLLENDFIWSSSSVMVKKSVIDNVGLFDESLKNANDWEMWIRIAQKYDFDFVDEPLFKYYWHGGNITRTAGNLKKIQYKEYILIKHKNLYKKHPKAYSITLRNIGTAYLLNNDLKNARKYFIKAIKVAPWYLRTYFNLIVSLFGSKFYKKILYQKRKMAGDFSLD